MAKATLEVVDVLRKAAKSLEQSSAYQWGHMGACNCGFLAQQVTQLTKEEIHRRALMSHGDWTEQLNDYCPTSGLPLDDVISELIAFGLDSADLQHLERLSDKNILLRFPLTERNLLHNKKTDAVRYMRAWADLLEEKLLSEIILPQVAVTISVH